MHRIKQRWSPRGHNLKSLASKSLVLENYPVLGSRTALFFEWLKFCRSAERIFSRPLFFGDRLKKIFFEDLFFRRTLAFVSLVLALEHSCPWPRECLSLALDFLCVLGLEPHCILDSSSGIRSMFDSVLVANCD